MVSSDASLEKSSSLLFFCALVTATLSYLFQWVMARALSVPDFGVLNTLIALLSIVCFPSKIFQTIAAKVAVERTPGECAFVFRQLRFAAMGVSLLFLLAAPWIFSFLRLESFATLPLLFFFAFFTLSLGVPWGYLQGEHRFREFGLHQIVLHGTKLVFAGFAVYFATGLMGALLALNLSVLVTFLFGHFSLPRVTAKPSQEGFRLLPGTSSLLFLFYLLGYCDLILAKRYLDETSLGVFAAVAVVGKAVLSLSDSVLNTLFPMVTRLKADASRLVFRAAALEVLLFAPVISVFYFAGPTLMGLLGETYQGAATYLPIYAVAMLALALTKIPALYWMAHDRFHLIIPLTLTFILLVTRIAYRHETVSDFISAVGISMAVLLVTSYVDLFWGLSRREKAPTLDTPLVPLP